MCGKSSGFIGRDRATFRLRLDARSSANLLRSRWLATDPRSPFSPLHAAPGARYAFPLKDRKLDHRRARGNHNNDVEQRGFHL
jgi:hypothetical protein